MYGRVLGVDLGERRMGLAISDENATVARGYGLYERQGLDDDVKHLAEITCREQIKEIVLGLPLNMDGSTGAQARLTLDFQNELTKHLSVPIKLYDERLTTAEAERVLVEGRLSRRRRKQLRDGLAAVLILQGYLDRLNMKQAP